MNPVERHTILISNGWITRLDGLLRPPPEWHDDDAYTSAAAWNEHLRRKRAARTPS
jgi:hypothetical protein